MINVKIRKLHDGAVIPQYATGGAAGFDLVAVEDVIIAPGETKKVALGIAFEIPPGYEMQIRPRSGISLNTKLRIANSLGTVDADFRGEVAVIVDNTAPPTEYYGVDYEGGDATTLSGETVGGYYRDGTYLIRKGDRIAQGLIAPVSRANFVEVAELSDTARGSGGFGSSGIRVEVGVE